jgi:hypothetical protein
MTPGYTFKQMYIIISGQNQTTFYALACARPEMVDCGSDQGRSVFETAGVARLRRGSQRRENTELGRKMLFMDGH